MRKFTFRNMWLVAKREYLERVKTKAFLILTLITPILIVALGVGPSAIMMSKSSGVKHLMVVAPDAELAAAVKKNLEAPPDEPKDTSKDSKDAKDSKSSNDASKQIADIAGLKFTAETSTDMSSANKATQQQRIDKKEIDGFLWLDPTATSTHSIPYTAASTTDFLEITRIRNAAREALMAAEFAKSGVNTDKLHELLKPYDLDATNWVQGKAKKAGDIQF